MITLLFALVAAMPAIAPAEPPTLEVPRAEVVELDLEVSAPPPKAAANGKGCPKHVERCSAQQAGQPCHPDNLNVLCSAQANGAYCCLAYAP